jgi:hypothetical protein
MPTLKSRLGRIPDSPVAGRQLLHNRDEIHDRPIGGHAHVRRSQLYVRFVFPTSLANVKHEDPFAHRFNEIVQGNAGHDVEIDVHVVRRLGPGLAGALQTLTSNLDCGLTFSRRLRRASDAAGVGCGARLSRSLTLRGPARDRPRWPALDLALREPRSAPPVKSRLVP